MLLLRILNAAEYIAAVDQAYGACDGAAALEQKLLSLAEECANEHGRNSALYASMLSEVGSFYRGQTRYEESAEFFNRTIAILRIAVGTSSPDFTTALNNLAGTYRQMRRFDEAEALFRRCLESYAHSVGTQHILYASGLNNLALVSLDRGDTARAKELLDQSSAILAQLPECRDEYATSLCNTGVLLCNLGQYEEAERRLREAIVLYKTELGTDTPHYHAAWNSLGIVCFRQNRFAEAEPCFLAAYEAAKTLYSAEHREAQSALQALQLVRQKLEATK